MGSTLTIRYDAVVHDRKVSIFSLRIIYVAMGQWIPTTGHGLQSVDMFPDILILFHYFPVDK